MKIKNSVYIVLFFLGFCACSPYEDYIKDFDYSIVYFSTQKPLRTIVAYDDMKFKVGVGMGGKRENNVNEIVEFEIDPALLADADLLDGNTFTLLPEAYYELSNKKEMIVEKGSFIGDVTVTLNTEAFTSDPLATGNNYALPFRVVNATTDSISSGTVDQDGNVITAPKDYTIVVVKYISPWHGTYYHKGVETEVDGGGNVIATEEYNNQDLVKNSTWDLSTIERFKVRTSGIGSDADHSIIIEQNEAAELTISTDDPAISDFEGTGSYDENERSFYLNYSFSDAGKNFEVVDTLVIRQAPELDLRFEEW